MPVVWGGIHASLLPHQTLENPNIDIVVVGEGEATFTEVVQALQTGRPLEEVDGIYFKRGAEVKSTPKREFIDTSTASRRSPITWSTSISIVATSSESTT